jgi:hypothetical protein
MTVREMTARSILLAMIQLGAAASAVTLFAGFAISDDQEEAKARDSIELRETARLVQAELPRWQIALGDRKTELKLNSKTLLRWTNPAAGRMNGEIYVWTVDGRPEAVMSLYKVWEPAWGFAGEFHSLSLTKLVAERDRAVVWKCNQPGITPSDVPDAAAVSETSPRRLQQMRAIAHDFSAVLIDSRNNPKGESQALRLMAQPLYRYASPAADVVDGALFGFVLGTDIEVLLLLEARGAKDSPRWQYALARLNSDDLAALYKDKEVWRVGRARFEDRDGPYAFMSLSESSK